MVFFERGRGCFGIYDEVVFFESPQRPAQHGAHLCRARSPQRIPAARGHRARASHHMERVFGLAQPILAPLKAVWRGVEVFFLGYPGICPRQAREKAPVQGAPPPVPDATPQGDTRQWAVSTTPTAVRPLVFFFLHLQPRTGWGITCTEGDSLTWRELRSALTGSAQ